MTESHTEPHEPVRDYSERHDADFCTVCMEWIDPPCIDPSCEFCRDRPEKAPPNKEG